MVKYVYLQHTSSTTDSNVTHQRTKESILLLRKSYLLYKSIFSLFFSFTTVIRVVAFIYYLHF